jgi:SAM-dependent methyltransferase
MTILDKNYWSDRYISGKTGWDIGFASNAISQYLDQIKNKEIQVLFPGAGNAYEVESAYANGFRSVHLLDYSTRPITNFIRRNPLFPKNLIHNEDFFEHKGRYDLIVEQTFFCALKPDLRQNYVSKMNELLNPGGKLVGVLFDRAFDFQGPPFGGKKKEYYELFESEFDIKLMSPCNNSIPDRIGSELFFILEKLKV